LHKGLAKALWCLYTVFNSLGSGPEWLA
jgi:hypothetical protein